MNLLMQSTFSRGPLLDLELFFYTHHHMTLSDFANHLVALLVIANPLSALTAMIRVTYNQSVAQKRHTALMVLIASSAIMLIAAWVGKPLLAILGIKLPAFQVAGSIIILFLAFSMLYAEESPMKQSP